jgi:mannosyltransferase OCH1-like enzyme
MEDLEGKIDGRSLFQYWHSSEIPDYIRGLMDSFKRQNPDFSHRVFDEAAAERFIAVHLGPRELACFRACAVRAMQADYFRYCALLACGGIYADADSRCVGPLRSMLEAEDSARIFRVGKSLRLNGTEVEIVTNHLLVFKEPHHPLLELVLSIATSQIERRAENEADGGLSGHVPGVAIWWITSPGIWTALCYARRLASLEEFFDILANAGQERFARTICEAVGDEVRLARAFEGVRIASLDDCEVEHQPDDVSLPYRETEAHWARFTASIYR